MNRKSLLTLVTVALILLLTLVTLNNYRQPDDGLDQLLLPDLEAQLNDIDGIRLTASGNQPIATLERTDQGWILNQKSGYRADLARIRVAGLEG